MSEAPTRDSPAYLEASQSTVTPDEAGVQLAERPFLGHLNLRGEPTDERFLEGAAKVLGMALPLEPNTVSQGEGTTVLWLGPDEWLAMTPPNQESGTVDALEKELYGLHTAVTDVTGGQTVITIGGPHARNTLAKGCSLDLHPRVFGPGQCAQTLVAKAGVTIVQTNDPPSYDLIVRRSFADHVARWLQDAAQEYGVMVVGPPPG